MTERYPAPTVRTGDPDRRALGKRPPAHAERGPPVERHETRDDAREQGTDVGVLLALLALEERAHGAGLPTHRGDRVEERRGVAGPVEAVPEAVERLPGEGAEVGDRIEAARGPRAERVEQEPDVVLDRPHLSVRERGGDPAGDLAVLRGLVAQREDDGIRARALGTVEAVEGLEALSEERREHSCKQYHSETGAELESCP